MTEPTPLDALWPRRPLGRTGLMVSALGVGGAYLGQLHDPDADLARKEEEVVRLVQAAVQHGINYFDTAALYMARESERRLGLALKALPSDWRARLIISTKAGRYGDGKPNAYDGDSILRSVETSLRLLYSDRLDILLIHDPESDAHMDTMLGPGGAVAALEELKAQGVIRAIGLGVRTHSFLRRAVESGRFDVILPSYDYNLIRRSVLPVMELAAARGVGVINASPYVSGLLAGGNPDVVLQRVPFTFPGDVEKARHLWRWTQERGLDLGALAMQYSIRNPHIATTLAGPRTVAELEANIRHATTPLPSSIWDELAMLQQGWE